MKLDLCWRGYGKRIELCAREGCRAPTIERVDGEDGTVSFHCATCRHTSKRRIVLDPAMRWWIADDREYWHESTGVFVRRDTDHKFLFFKRRVHPVSKLTVPSGHLDTADKSAMDGALRELREETGLRAASLRHIATEDITCDSCRRGSDAHRWHAYLVLGSSPKVKVSGEGTDPQWLTLTEAMAKAEAEGLTHPVRYIIERYGTRLERVGR